jgi:hypothetical protein
MKHQDIDRAQQDMQRVAEIRCLPVPSLRILHVVEVVEVFIPFHRGDYILRFEFYKIQDVLHDKVEVALVLEDFRNVAFFFRKNLVALLVFVEVFVGLWLVLLLGVAVEEVVHQQRVVFLF